MPPTVPSIQKALSMYLVTEPGHTGLSSESRTQASSSSQAVGLSGSPRDRSHPVPSSCPRLASVVCITHSLADMHQGLSSGPVGEGPGSVVWTQSRHAFMSQPDSCLEHLLSPQQHISGASFPSVPSPGGQRPDPLNQTELTLYPGCPSSVPDLIFSL